MPPLGADVGPPTLTVNSCLGRYLLIAMIRAGGQSGRDGGESRRRSPW